MKKKKASYNWNGTPTQEPTSQEKDHWNKLVLRETGAQLGGSHPEGLLQLSILRGNKRLTKKELAEFIEKKLMLLCQGKRLLQETWGYRVSFSFLCAVLFALTNDKSVTATRLRRFATHLHVKAHSACSKY